MEGRRKENSISKKKSNQNYAERLSKINVQESEVPGIFKSNISFTICNKLVALSDQPDQVVDEEDLKKFNWKNPFAPDCKVTPIQNIDVTKQKEALIQLEAQRKAIEQEIKAIKRELGRVELHHALNNKLATFVSFKEKIFKAQAELTRIEQEFNLKISALQSKLKWAQKNNKYLLQAYNLEYYAIPQECSLKNDAILFAKMKLDSLLDEFIDFASTLIWDNPSHPQVEENEADLVLKNSIRLIEQLNRDFEEAQNEILIKDATEILNTLKESEKDGIYIFDYSTPVSIWLSRLKPEQLEETKALAEKTLDKEIPLVRKKNNIKI